MLAHPQQYGLIKEQVYIKEIPDAASRSSVYRSTTMPVATHYDYDLQVTYLGKDEHPVTISLEDFEHLRQKFQLSCSFGHRLALIQTSLGECSLLQRHKNLLHKIKLSVNTILKPGHVFCELVLSTSKKVVIW